MQTYQPLNQAQKLEADSRNTSYPVWAAIIAASTEPRTPADVWEEQTEGEHKQITDLLVHWKATGQIDEDEKLYWGFCQVRV